MTGGIGRSKAITASISSSSGASPDGPAKTHCTPCRLERPEGVVIGDIHSLSPFAAAGISTGDVLVAIDGQPSGHGSYWARELM